jgi:hypothetical protein
MGHGAGMKTKKTDNTKDIPEFYNLIIQLYQDEVARQESLDSKLTQLLGVCGLLQSLLLGVTGLIINAKATIPSGKYTLILLALCAAIVWFGIAILLALIGLWPRQYSSFSIEVLQNWVETNKSLALTMTGWLAFIRQNRILNKQKGLFTWLTTLWIAIGSAVFITIAVIVIAWV